MLPVYRYKDTLLHGLNPVISLFLVVTLAVTSLLLENPVYTALVCAATLALIYTADVWEECKAFMRIGLVVALFIAVLNPLINNQGIHVLIYGPRIPLWGNLDITLEAILYGLSSAVRVFTVIMVFGLASTVINPDDLLGMFSRFSSRSSLSAALAVRLYPSMVSEAREIREVQLVRGERLKGGGRLSRARSYMPMLLALFQGSLDRAACIAESMSARGFGSGRRTQIRRHHFRPRDAVIAAVSLAVLGVAIAAAVAGRSAYSFFPTLSDPWNEASHAALAALTIAFVAIIALSRSWKKWHWLRSRI
ncbi:MAG: energy-coupling factor transporter transmembrane protein EcfT [Actinobacteria bacterium]|nr:energy-coupling factor transporter transmembrane protein EcfT [Actinomycetota bacterium]